MCGGSFCVPYMALSSKNAIVNGIIQIVAGAIASAFGIGFSVLPTSKGIPAVPASRRPGMWCGALFITGGIVMLIAGCKRNFCCTIGALVLAVINVILGVTFLLFLIPECGVNELLYRGVISQLSSHLHPWRSGENWRDQDPFGDLDRSDRNYQIAVFMLSASILAAFAEAEAIVIASRALCRGGCSGGTRATTAPEVHNNVKARNNSLPFNWISHLASTIVSAVSTCVILFIVACGVQSGEHDRRALSLQKWANLWCAPVYLVAAFCGDLAWRFGENSSLMSFLILNILQLALCPWELAFSAAVLGDNRSDPALMAFHALVITSAAHHFCFAIWGIVAAAIAIHQDDACSCRKCGCCCAHDDGDHTDKINFVTASATPAFGYVKASSCAIEGVPVVFQNGAIVDNAIVAGEVDAPPNHGGEVEPPTNYGGGVDAPPNHGGEVDPPPNYAEAVNKDHV